MITNGWGCGGPRQPARPTPRPKPNTGKPK